MFLNNNFTITQLDDKSIGVRGILDKNDIHVGDCVKVTFKNGKQVMCPIDYLYVGAKRLYADTPTGPATYKATWTSVRSAVRKQPICIVFRKGYLHDNSPDDIATLTAAHESLVDMIFGSIFTNLNKSVGMSNEYMPSEED